MERSETLRRRHVYCVDGDPVFLELVRDILGDRYTVTVTEFAPGALKEVQALKPDLIMVDLAVGTRRGFELLEQLVNDCRTRDIPVVALSTSPTLLEEARETRYSADGYISKPFDVQHLLAAVDGLLSDRSVHR
jgi:CheY-like chemotaxis protein